MTKDLDYLEHRINGTFRQMRELLVQHQRTSTRQTQGVRKTEIKDIKATAI